MAAGQRAVPFSDLDGFGLLINGLEKHSRVCLSLYFLPRVGQTMSGISHTVLAEAWQISGRAEGNDGEAPA